MVVPCGFLFFFIFCWSKKKNVSLQKNSHGRRNVVRPSSSSSIHLSIYRKRRKLDSGIALGKQRRTKKITFAFLNMLHHHHRLSRDIFVRCWSSSLWAPGTHKISEKNWKKLKNNHKGECETPFFFNIFSVIFLVGWVNDAWSPEPLNALLWLLFHQRN